MVREFIRPQSLLHGDAPVLPIVAGSQTEQLRRNIAALGIRLNEDQLQRLNTAGDPAIQNAWLR